MNIQTEIDAAEASPGRSKLVRSSERPWKDIRAGQIKALHRCPETGWTHQLLRGFPGQVNMPHTHEAPALFYVIEGGFDFRGGSAGVGDWVWEPAGAVHEATSHSLDTVYFGTIFGPVTLHTEEGKPPGYGDPIGAALVHTAELPWLEDGRGGQIRVLRTSPVTGWMHLMLRGAAGDVRAPHVCMGPCEMFVLEGELDYGETRLGPGDWLLEPAGARVETLRFRTDAVVLVNLYGPALFDQQDLMDWRSLETLKGKGG